MKKTIYMVVGLFIIVTIYSCEKEGVYKAPVAKGKKVKVTASETKASDTGVDPVIIPGENPGGNRTCTEVAAYFNLDPNPFYCGDQVDYNGEFSDDAFPEGLYVEVTDDTYVSFNMDDCIQIEDAYYKVGAVIVKGSDDANVYYYGPDGTLGDSGLSSPVNASGKPSELSNLSFCFIKCEREKVDLVLAMKTYILEEGDPEKERAWAVIHGTGSETDALNIGYKSIFDSDITLYFRYYDDVVGYVTVTQETDSEGEDYLKIYAFFNEEHSDWTFEESYLYVGTPDGFLNYIVGQDSNGDNVTNFKGFPFLEDTSSSSRTFDIYYDEITE